MESTSAVVAIVGGLVTIIGGIVAVCVAVWRWVARRKSHYDNPEDAFYFGEK